MGSSWQLHVNRNHKSVAVFMHTNSHIAEFYIKYLVSESSQNFTNLKQISSQIVTQLLQDDNSTAKRHLRSSALVSQLNQLIESRTLKRLFTKKLHSSVQDDIDCTMLAICLCLYRCNYLRTFANLAVIADSPSQETGCNPTCDLCNGLLIEMCPPRG